jgi:putative CocE/NonD family hydrolase
MWSERGYNVMVQGVRGRYNSTDKHIPFNHEREDGIATLQWLHEQPWHNGKTGMWGGSYFGYTQWVLSDQDSLGLSALLTQISSSSNYAMLHTDGTFSYESALFWATRSHSDKDTPFDYEHLRKGYDSAPLLEADDRVVADIPFFNDWASHEQFDEFWSAVDGVDRAKHLQVPALMMAGWYDPFLTSQIQDFEDISQYADPMIAEQCRLIIGPWAHAETVIMPNGYQDRNYRLASIAPAINWYDEHLKQKATKPTPHVRIFVMGVNEWRDEESFPLQRTIYTPYYLSANATNAGTGSLLQTPPSYDSYRQTYDFDPAKPVPSLGGAVLGARAGAKKQNEIEERDDVLVYTSPELDQDVEVTGKIKLILHVATNAKSTDFMAKLCDVHPDGSSFNVSEGALRKTYQDNGRSERIEIVLNPTSNVFLKDHRIRLIVSSSSYPRYSLNYNKGTNNYDERNGMIAHQTVHTGTEFLSKLILPVIPAIER